MSPVNIEELTTEVVPDAAPAGAAERPAWAAVPFWEHLERVRRAEARLTRERARTRAEGFDA